MTCLRHFMAAIAVVMLVMLMTIPSYAYADVAYADADAEATSSISYEQVADKKKKSSGSYMEIDMTNLAQKDSDKKDSDGGGANLVQNGTSFLQMLVNKWLLPIGFVVAFARLMYIAIFPLMIGMDPLDVLDVDSFREGPQSVLFKHTRGGMGDGSNDPTIGTREYDWGSKGDWRVKLSQEQIQYIMKQELIGAGKVMLVVIIVWAVLNLSIWFAGIILSQIRIWT